MTDQNTTAAITKGAHHLGLTVPDLEQTRRFFIDTLGYEQLGEVPDYPAVFLSDGTTMITLWQAVDPANAVPFDRKNVIGLHHFALSVDSGDLDDLHQRLEKTGDVEIEFAPEPLGDMPVRHMMCNIPGGIRVEFLAANA
jgi:catechol 2,3-dioxygenase-like lactoylglutathione lyase family enzyme